MKQTILLYMMLITGMLQAQNFAWVNQIGGTLNQKGNSLVTDINGNVYTTGYFEGVVDFDPGTGILNLTSAGGYDIFITKTNAAGSLVWVKQIGGANPLASDEGKSIAVGAQGDVYVTGTFRDMVDFDPGEGVFYMESMLPNVEGCSPSPDVFILKLNSAGEFVWARQLGGDGFDKSSSIVLGDGESVYVSGEYVTVNNVPVDFDPTPDTFFMTPLAGAGAFLLKLDVDGNFNWAKQWYSNGIFAIGCGLRDAGFHPISLTVDGSGNVCCTGDFSSTVDFNPDAGTYNLSTLSNSAFVMKLNSGGNFLWACGLITSGSHAYGKDVTVGSNGNVYSIGHFDGTFDFDPGSGVRNLKAPGPMGNTDAYVWVLNSAGTYVWAGQLGGNTNDVATSIDLDESGGMYITGTFTGTADFNPGNAKNTLKAVGDADIYVAKLTTAGSYVWAVRWGGTLYENTTALDVDASGSILTTGTFQGTSDFDPSSANYTLTSLGASDAFVHKMTQSGGGNFTRAWSDQVYMTEVTVFPNPTTEVLNVDFAQHAEDIHVQIYDLHGQLMLEKIHFTGRRITIDVSTLPKGMYLVKIKDDLNFPLHPFIKPE